MEAQADPLDPAIVSAPVWDSHESRFTGILTATDFINVIQYYYQFPEEISKLDHFRLSSLRGMWKEATKLLGVRS